MIHFGIVPVGRHYGLPQHALYKQPSPRFSGQPSQPIDRIKEDLDAAVGRYGFKAKAKELQNQLFQAYVAQAKAQPTRSRSVYTEAGNYFLGLLKQVDQQTGKTSDRALVTLHQTAYFVYLQSTPEAQQVFTRLQRRYNQEAKTNRTDLKQSPLLRHFKQAAIEATSKETAYDAARYERIGEDYPMAEHCKAVAQAIETLMGGRIVKAKVRGHAHYFNVINNGTELDMSNEQYRKDQSPAEQRALNGWTPAVESYEDVPPSKSINTRFKKYYRRVIEHMVAKL